LSFAIGFIDMTTARASAAGVARINGSHSHACQLAFVFDKGAKLSKRPARQGCSLRLTSRYPLADTRQFFNGNPASGVFSLCNDLFADNVVYVFGKALFFARQFLETATCGLRAFGLQLSAQLAVTKAHRLDGLALVNGSVAVGGDVGNAQVNAQEIVNIVRGWFVHVAALVEVKLAFAIDKIAFAAQTLKQLGGMFTGSERHLLATCHCPDRDNLLAQFVGDKSVVEGERTVRLERALRAFVELVGVSDFGKDAHGDICPKSKLRANVSVAELVQLELPEYTFSPSHVTDIAARSIGRFQCLQEQGVLFWRRLQLDARNQFHVCIIPSIGIIGNLGMQEVCADSPSPLKRGVPSALFYGVGAGERLSSRRRRPTTQGATGQLGNRGTGT